MTGVEDELTLMKEVVMRTNDQWRHNRRLVNDAMSPRFLSNIASQQVYNQALNLVELWRQKMRLSKGHAFDLRADLRLCTADSIWATTFGDDIAACKVQSDYLRSLDSIKLLEDEEALAQFPAKPDPDAYAAWKAIVESCEIPMNSPLGHYHHVSSAKQDEKATNRFSIVVRPQIFPLLTPSHGTQEQYRQGQGPKSLGKSQH
jgi:hypothetical protein